MADLASTVGLREALRASGFDPDGDFEAVYDSVCRDESQSELKDCMENRIREYFELLRLPDSITLYDRLVLSLKERDVIATFNWDPLLAEAYSRNSVAAKPPKVLYLHGNVALGVCHSCRSIGWHRSSCQGCGGAFDPLPLLYPVSEKDYTGDGYLKYAWDALRDTLGNAYMLTIFGYRAPTSDAAAIDIMKVSWSENPVLDLAQVAIVDIRQERDLRESWKPFFVRDHYGTFDDISDTWLFRNARRSCETFFQATMLLDPWHQRPMPNPHSLAELHNWVEPLVAEEATEPARLLRPPAPSS